MNLAVMMYWQFAMFYSCWAFILIMYFHFKKREIHSLQLEQVNVLVPFFMYWLNDNIPYLNSLVPYGKSWRDYLIFKSERITHSMRKKKVFYWIEQINFFLNKFLITESRKNGIVVEEYTLKWIILLLCIVVCCVCVCVDQLKRAIELW